MFETGVRMKIYIPNHNLIVKDNVLLKACRLVEQLGGGGLHNSVVTLVD